MDYGRHEHEQYGLGHTWRVVLHYGVARSPDLSLSPCPCHLPVFGLLLSGTAAGAFLTDHFGSALAVLGVLFLLSLTFAMQLLQGDETRKE